MICRESEQEREKAKCKSEKEKCPRTVQFIRKVHALWMSSTDETEFINRRFIADGNRNKVLHIIFLSLPSTRHSPLTSVEHKCRLYRQCRLSSQEYTGIPFVPSSFRRSPLDSCRVNQLNAMSAHHLPFIAERILHMLMRCEIIRRTHLHITTWNFASPLVLVDVRLCADVVFFFVLYNDFVCQ